ncbi:hypothetical protein Sjap_023705 [Stephania japonica]|uniref:NADP-dependent oxidoreductase domain-containing protein n=1 Tax=Stephania japonica TaxID=461633 RepID=A0AAP0EHC7_9MAGN
MKVKCIPEVILNNGCKMPMVGMGMACYPFPESETAKAAMLKAIEIGCKHFDTSPPYKTEQPLSLTIAEALKHGLIKSHDELFITSSSGAVMLTLTLSFLHFKKLSSEFTIIATATATAHILISISSHRLGLTKFIGVSNFSCKKLEYLLTTAKIPPTVNQVRRFYVNVLINV